MSRAHLLSRRSFMLGMLALPACGKSNSLTEASAKRQSCYVAPNGDDSNDGTTGHPWRTLRRAAESVQSGMTVIVAPGNYAESVRTGVSGVHYVGKSARVHAASEYIWHNTGSGVLIEGFEIVGDAGRCRIGIYNQGDRCTVSRCTVHDLPAIGSGANGGAGVDHTGLDCQTLGCSISNVGVGSGNKVHGVYHASAGGSVIGNTFSNIQAYGIHVYPAARDVVVTNNRIESCRQAGIIVGGVGAIADGITVTSNVISDCPIGIIESGLTGTRNRYENNLPMTGVRIPYLLQNGLVGS